WSGRSVRFVGGSARGDVRCAVRLWGWSDGRGVAGAVISHDHFAHERGSPRSTRREMVARATISRISVKAGGRFGAKWSCPIVVTPAERPHRTHRPQPQPPTERLPTAAESLI